MSIQNDCEAIWRLAEKHSCPDCFHGGCLAITDAAIALVKAIRERGY